MATATQKGNPLVQAGIVVILVASMVTLFRLTGDGSLLDQPRGQPGALALVAFGFVVLASFTIGRFVDVIRLPHITGYLLAGMLFGEAIAHLIAQHLATPLLGFVENVVGPGVASSLAEYGRVLKDGFLFSDGRGGGTLGSLAVIKTLAVALIAMTAGGELKLESLRKGFKVISAVLVGQSVIMLVLITGATVLLAEPLLTTIPAASDRLAVAAAMGLVVAAISLATSPAATIAVVNETRSAGPLTQVILATVVLKDVVVVVLFSVASAAAGTALGIADDKNLVAYLVNHIGVSIGVGVILGGLMALYLRFVGRELLLMIVAVVYAATLFADASDLDPVLLFLAAGFTTSNFSKEGDTLIHSVERLSTPVYVVFFTLAGAELHLEELPAVFPLALGLVLLRALSLYLGVSLGGRFTGAEKKIQTYGWLGFLSQAGVAIVLAELVGSQLGPTGQQFQRILISAVALNELVGPMLLKVGLTRSKEVGARDQDTGRASFAPPAPEESAEAPTRDSQSPSQVPAVEPWPAPEPPAEPLAPTFRSDELNQEWSDLAAQLEAISLGVAKGPFRRNHLATEAALRSLRREFLRSHRRLAVRLRNAGNEEAEKADPLAQWLHREQAELVRRWRGEVMLRATAVKRAEWSPDQLVETLDKIVESSPEWLLAPYEPQSFEWVEGQTTLRAIRRAWLRLRKTAVEAFGGVLRRRIPFRVLVRYHFYGATPARLEALAALLARAEMHILDRSRELFAKVVEAYEELVESEADEENPEAPAPLDETRLRRIRDDVEAHIELCLNEIDRITRSKSQLLARIFQEAMNNLAGDLRVAGTLDLAARTRRSSRVLHDRFRALSVLSDDLKKTRHAIAGSYRLLSMELELRGLEVEVRDVLAEQGSMLARSIRGRAYTQASRVNTALSELLEATQAAIAKPDQSGEELAKHLKTLWPPLRKITDEAIFATSQLYEQLSDDNTLAPLLDLLRRATGSLSEVYEVPTRALTFSDPNRLPQLSSSMEVPFRSLVSGHLEGSIAPKLAHVTRQVAGELHPLVTALQELSRLLDLKFDLAISELDAVLDEPIDADTQAVLKELVVTGFSRNLELLRSQVDAAAAWSDAVEHGLLSETLEGLARLRGKLQGGELSQLRIDVMRRKAARRRFLRHAEQLPGRIEQARIALRNTVVAVLGEERLHHWWVAIGLPTREAPAPTAQDFAVPKPRTELPLVYRRLFSAEALDLRALRQPEIQRARAALSRGAGAVRAAAFVGPEGVGKGALAQAVVRASGVKSVRRLTLEKPVTTEEVRGWFEENQPGQLVVVSGFHWMVSLEPGGFEPLRCFVRRMLADRGHTAFVLTADEAVWNLARQALPLEEAFSEVVQVEPLSPTELESVVMGRHRLSGSGVDFSPSRVSSAVEEFFSHGPGWVRRPYESFFDSLHRSSGGLVREAFRLWLASVESMGRDFVKMGEVPSPATRALHRLPEDVLLQLMQVLRQGWTSPSVFAALYRQPLEHAQAELAFLSRLGLLSQAPGDVYTITPHLRGSVFRVMRERRWV